MEAEKKLLLHVCGEKEGSEPSQQKRHPRTNVDHLLMSETRYVLEKSYRKSLHQQVIKFYRDSPV